MKKKVLTLDIKLIIQIVVIAIYLIGCSGTNTVPTLESMPTDIPTLIPSITNTPLPPTKTATPIPPSPTTTETGKTNVEYQLMREELNNLPELVRAFDSPSGHDTNYIWDTDSFQGRQLRELVGYYIVLSCNRPEMLVDFQFEPFLLETQDGESLDINIGNCKYTKETLEKLEKNGHMISLSHPVLPPEASDMLEDVIPGVKFFEMYDTKGNLTENRTLNLTKYGGMVLGMKDYKNFILDLIKVFNLDMEYVYFDIAKFKSNATGFTIPVDSDGNILFSKVMVIPKNATPQQIEKYITLGTAADLGLFMSKAAFLSEELP